MPCDQGSKNGIPSWEGGLEPPCLAPISASLNHSPPQSTRYWSHHPLLRESRRAPRYICWRCIYSESWRWCITGDRFLQLLQDNRPNVRDMKWRETLNCYGNWSLYVTLLSLLRILNGLMNHGNNFLDGCPKVDSQTLSPGLYSSVYCDDNGVMTMGLNLLAFARPLWLYVSWFPYLPTAPSSTSGTSSLPMGQGNKDGW